MKINNAWYVDELPDHAVIETEHGQMAMFLIVPFRTLTEDDLIAYKGHNPRKMKGQPIPEYIYKFYGLKKNDEAMSEVIRARIRPSEKQAFLEAADGKTESEFLREIVLDKIRKTQEGEGDKAMRYAVIDRPINGLNGDEFVEFYKTKEEAVKQARYSWDRLTALEKKKRNVIAGTMSENEEDCDVYEILWESQEA